MKKLFFCSLIITILFSCSLGPNPNPGERTIDNLIADEKYKKAIIYINKQDNLLPWELLRLAVLYEEGLGYEKDISQAFRLYKEVAKKWGDDPWSNGDMAGDPMFGNAGYYNQNNNALFAQYKIAQFYYKGIYVKKDLVKSYFLIKNIISKAKSLHEFKGLYCCSYFAYQQVSIGKLNDDYVEIEAQLNFSQKQEIERLTPVWTIENDL
jgi:hypothetical protein